MEGRSACRRAVALPNDAEKLATGLEDGNAAGECGRDSRRAADDNIGRDIAVTPGICPEGLLLSGGKSKGWRRVGLNCDLAYISG